MGQGDFSLYYDIVGRIPRGKVATYGQIARMAGRPRNARMVGWAMAACPAEKGLPCHRVVDRLGGTKAAFDLFAPNTQQRLLEAEGVAFLPNGRVDLSHFLWHPENTDNL